MDYLTTRNNVWLFSSNFGNRWWCYNEENSKKLDIIMSDYEKRHKSPDNDIKNLSHDSQNIVHTINDKTIANPSYDPVAYNDQHDNDVLHHDDSDYTINVGNTKYMIDLDKWQQINLFNKNKKRNLKLLPLPPHLNIMQKVDFLKNNNVVGIAGTEFDNLTNKP